MKTLIKIVILAALLATIPLKASAKTLTVAVIDTGIDYRLPNLCRFGHKSFVPFLPDPLKDEHGHGSHVAGLISSNAGIGDYCLVSIKYYSDKAKDSDNGDRYLQAIQYAINIHVDFINLSNGGEDYQPREKDLIEQALGNGIKIVASAGNEGKNLGRHPFLNDGLDTCVYFPACYDNRITVVGNIERSSLRSPSSNYGNYVKRWEIGTDVLSTLPGGRTGRMTGTSQSAGIATGKLIREALYR